MMQSLLWIFDWWTAAGATTRRPIAARVRLGVDLLESDDVIG